MARFFLTFGIGNLSELNYLFGKIVLVIVSLFHTSMPFILFYNKIRQQGVREIRTKTSTKGGLHEDLKRGAINNSLYKKFKVILQSNNDYKIYYKKVEG